MKLYYFTASYPFGLGELWKANELKVLVNHFDKVVVVPFSYDGNFQSPKQLPSGVELLGPLFEGSSLKLNKISALTRIISSRFGKLFIREFFDSKAWLNKAHFGSWLYASMNVIRLMDHPVVRQIVQQLDKETILYFFWGKGAAEIIPFIDNKKYFKSFVKMHRYDLFETVNNNYIPYRSALMERATVIAPSSQAGLDHLLHLYPGYSNKIKLFRLGTITNGKMSRASTDNIFRVVSCSYLSKVKRVELMVESLRYIDFPILWRHIGDGDQRKEIENLIHRYQLGNKFIIEGFIDTNELLDFYTSNSFDLFVNVSASEGVPMSIMEALSVYIPVMATRVGGNGELVDDSVGKLLAPDPSARELASAITDYYHLPAQEKEQRRESAFKRAKEQCDAIQLANDLVVALKSSAS